MDHQAQFAASEMQNAEWGTFQHGQQQNNPFLAMTMNSSTLGTSNMSPMNNGMVESIGGIDQSNGNINLHSQSMMQQHTIPPEQAPTPGLQRPYSSENMQSDQPPARRAKMETNSHAQPGSSPKLPNTIVKHSHLLDRSDSEGARLFSFYKLSVDELFRLPPTPTDEEYLSLVNSSGLMNASSISGSQLVALSAARFAEIALGAVVHNEISLAMELCNAVVHCLRESVQESSGPILFEIAKAYFLLGVFRAYRGDMDRYFRYRKVCMSYLGKLEVRDVCMAMFPAYLRTSHLFHRTRVERLSSLLPFRSWIPGRIWFTMQMRSRYQRRTTIQSKMGLVVTRVVSMESTV